MLSLEDRIDELRRAVGLGAEQGKEFFAAQFTRVADRIDKIGMAIDALDTRGETITTFKGLEPEESAVVIEDRRGYLVRIVNAWCQDGVVDLYRGSVTPSNYVGSTLANGVGISRPITILENQAFIAHNPDVANPVTVVVEAVLVKTERCE